MYYNNNDNSFRKNVVSFQVKFSQLKTIRVDNKELRIEFQSLGQSSAFSALPNKLTLPYCSIHPEGYRTWFSFDNDVECLVIIQFTIKGSYSGSRISLTEHTQIIWHIFKYRFKENLKYNNLDEKILQTHQQCKKKTSSLQQKVNPHSNDAFWPSYKSILVSNDIDSASPNCSNKLVHCHELELAYDDNDEPIEEQFCRCSEWCNVSAFYFHNPIFRFLMVQFTNFYICSNANLPSSYMCALSYLFVESSKKQVFCHLSSMFGD